MFNRNLLLPIVLALAAANSISAQVTNPLDCSDVHFFLARGSNEKYPGFLGETVDVVCDEVETREKSLSCDYEDVIYPAALGSGYCDSVEQGITALGQRVRSYARRCPESKLVLLGFSQGAVVVGDALSGVSGGASPLSNCEFPVIAPSITKTRAGGKNIVAVVSYGDPRHNANQKSNAADGNGFYSLDPFGDSLSYGAQYDGQRPRNTAEIDAMDPFHEQVLSFCNYGDPICATVTNTDPNDYTYHTAAAYRGTPVEKASKFISSRIV
ncbi:alpha/beta-hydrolase [Ascobolus immersus RN42]|uniref:Alpha/beta-hydrolase n=1 Tax=Ascobolus immersus RN42 TaxID=1160509 RepID=A0A3N4I5Y2_ASCIM|nr:alpha/beta-hydrolase [Ascobolus immersus RN42]